MSDAWASRPPEAVRRAAEVSARLKHDLGKYVGLQSRWLAPDAPLGDQVAALRQDLLATRRGADGTRDAIAVWDELVPALREAGLDATPEVLAVAAGMRGIETAIAELRAGELDAAGVVAAREAAAAVAEACRALDARVRVAVKTSGGGAGWPTS